MTRLEVQYVADDPDAAGDHLDALAELYAAAFAESPYNEGPEHVERFRERFPDESKRPGFALVRAVDNEGRLVGLAYGWTMPAGRWWTRASVEPLAYLLDVDKFAIMEWAVHPNRRGRGIGQQLMKRLLADRPEPYATLSANPAAAANGIYRRWGWKPAGRTEPKDLFPSQEILVRRLG